MYVSAYILRYIWPSMWTCIYTCYTYCTFLKIHSWRKMQIPSKNQTKGFKTYIQSLIIYIYIYINSFHFFKMKTTHFGPKAQEQFWCSMCALGTSSLDFCTWHNCALSVVFVQDQTKWSVRWSLTCIYTILYICIHIYIYVLYIYYHIYIYMYMFFIQFVCTYNVHVS